jgi:hypothetical protein
MHTPLSPCTSPAQVSGTDVNGNGTIDYEEFLAATIHQSKLEKVIHTCHAVPAHCADASLPRPLRRDPGCLD